MEQIGSEPTQKEIVLLVVDHAGREHALPALEGWRAMEVIRDWGISLKADCGGACACASCHVYVDEPWVERLAPPTAEEEPARRSARGRAVLAALLPDPDVTGDQRPQGAAGAGFGAGVSAMDRLDELEAQSIFVFREAFARMKKLALLWSLGKDSNVMIWLARKAFFGHLPFPVMHVDTGRKFPEMYAFRDRYAAEWDLDLIVEPCPPLESVDPTLPPAARSAARKTEGLKLALAKHGFDGLIAGIRRDEEATRAKERVFSPRGLEGNWDVRDQPPEFWDHFNARLPAGAHLRVHPILHWTETDVWTYTRREGIPIIPLYLAKDGKRYRSLGDADITFPVPSDARTIDEIIAELDTTKTPERSGRAMDHEAEDAFERLRASGYL